MAHSHYLPSAVEYGQLINDGGIYFSGVLLCTYIHTYYVDSLYVEYGAQATEYTAVTT